ncbi:MAG: substrate-binding domain-containing protein, partial [Planctomycetota bacterium]
MTDNHNTRWLYICVLLFPLILIGGCDNAGDTADRRLTVFHAGSLAVPFQEMAEEFERDKPGVRVRLEAAGSRTCARKISELGRRCDVLASADYRVIEELLMPEHARWVIRFAGNEIGIAYTGESTGSKRINEENWHDILMREDVRFGRSDPDSDPCGYRTVLALKLAERYYSAENLAKRMLTKDLRFLRPKETDLLTLLESGAVD